MKNILHKKDTKVLITFVLALLINVIFIVLSRKTFMWSRVSNLEIYLKQDLFEAIGNVIASGDKKEHGLYIWLLVIAKLFGLQTPQYVMCVSQIIATSILVIFIPIICWEIYDRRTDILIISVILLFICEMPVMWLKTYDVYWSMAWINIIAIPSLIYLWKKEINRQWNCIFVFLCVCMGFSNLIRAEAAIGVLCALVFVLILKFKNLKIITYAVFALLGYNLFTKFFILILILICKGDISMLRGDGGVWHSLYIGIGFEMNPFNIVHEDACARELVKKLNPSVEYVSKEYFSTLRGECLKLFKSNPEYFARSYIRKYCLTWYPVIVFAILDAIPIGAAALIWKKVKKENLLNVYNSDYGIYMIAFSICYIGSLIQPMIAVPSWEYELGTLGLAGIGLMLIILSGVCRLRYAEDNRGC